MELRDLITGYAAIVATIALLWNIYTSINDKGKLKLTGQFIDLLEEDNTVRKKLIIRVINVGKKPLVYEGPNGTIKGATQYRETIQAISEIKVWPPQNANEQKTLEAAMQHTITIDFSNPLVNNLERIYWRDSLGKRYTFKKKELRKLLERREEIKKGKYEGDLYYENIEIK